MIIELSLIILSLFLGVKFIFNKIDQNDQDKVYWFVVRLDGDIYTCKYMILYIVGSVQPLQYSLSVRLMH